MSFTSLDLLRPSVAATRMAEQQEREDRMHGDNTGTLNAFNIASLIKKASFPVVSHNKGSSRYFRSLEEQERYRLLSNPRDIAFASQKAGSVAALLRTTNTRILFQAGTKRYTRSLEEKERLRRLSDTVEQNIRRINAHKLSDSVRVNAATIRARLVKRRPIDAAVQKSKLALSAAIDALPSGEQVLNAADIAVHKVTDALPSSNQMLNAADIAVHKVTDALPTGTQVRHAADVAAHTVADALPTGDQVRYAADVAVHTVADVLPSGEQVRIAADTAANVAKAGVHKVSSFFPSMAEVVAAATHFKDAIQHAVQGDAELHPVGLLAIKSVEEAERRRRMIEDRNGRSVVNARIVSRLITSTRFPFNFSNTHAGYSRYLNRIGESERTRRLANKDEAHVRVMNAHKVSTLLTALGWPFIRSAKKGTHVIHATFYASEEERSRRVMGGDTLARYNARKVAALITEHSMTEDKFFVKKYTKGLEEKERKFRLKNAGLFKGNANREAQLIENVGFPFFVGSTEALEKRKALKELSHAEEEERQFRVQLAQAKIQEARIQAFKNFQKLAKSMRPAPAPAALFEDTQVAHIKTKQSRQANLEKSLARSHIISQDTMLLSEQERKDRMSDKHTQMFARLNANRVARMINAHNRKLHVQSLPLAPAPAKRDTVIEIQPTLLPQTQAKPILSQPTLPIQSQARQVPAFTKPLPVAPMVAPVLTKPLPPTPSPRLSVAPTLAPSPLLAAQTLTPSPMVETIALAPSPLLTAQTFAPSPMIETPTFVAPVQSTFVAPTLAPAPVQSTFVAPVQSTFVAPAFVAAPVQSTYVAPTSTTYAFPTTVPTSQLATPQPPTRDLIEKVRKMWEQELSAADKESRRVSQLSQKGSRFSNFRKNHHTNSASKHLTNAKRHEDWLRACGALPLPQQTYGMGVGAGRPAL